MDRDALWEVSDWIEVDNKNDPSEEMITKAWHRKFQDRLESWIIVGNPYKTDSEEFLYQVYYTETPVSLSLKDILLNLSELELSFSDGLSATVPQNAQVHLDEEEDVLTSFEDRDAAEEYVKQRL